MFYLFLWQESRIKSKESNLRSWIKSNCRCWVLFLLVLWSCGASPHLMSRFPSAIKHDKTYLAQPALRWILPCFDDWREIMVTDYRVSKADIFNFSLTISEIFYTWTNLLQEFYAPFRPIKPDPIKLNNINKLFWKKDVQYLQNLFKISAWTMYKHLI